MTGPPDFQSVQQAVDHVPDNNIGSNPYRDGSYEYYLSEKVVTNDPKGIGAFLLAATEMETRSVRGRQSQALQ